MRVPLSWLRDFIDIGEGVDELRSTFDDLGLVVEGIEVVGEGLDDVVVARVLGIDAIPGADKIRLARVDAGGDPIDVVCGAWNFEVGDVVPFAPVGATLPGGLAIGRRSLRGVTSHGMLCSPRELRLADDHQGLMILDPSLAGRVGDRLVDVLGLTPDVVFDLTVEGNRPDAWCVAGVARDLGARLGRELRAPVVESPSDAGPTSATVTARLDAPDLCGRLTVSALTGVTVAASPAWVARRLTYAGMRPINNVVDASNLVMLELGQPTHPYDAALVAGKTIGVRAAVAGERLTTLDGTERTLGVVGRGLGDTGVDALIVDGDDAAIGLAGIMGGSSSEISDATTDVLVEAAWFDPMTVARSSRRHGLRTEASARFERGVDPTLPLRAVGRLVAVLRESSPDVTWLGDPLDERGTLPDPSTIELTEDDVERALGSRVERAEYEAGLAALGFSVERDGETSRVTAPPSRPDVRSGVAGRADVIEEVARLHGYRRLPRHTPSWPEPGSLDARGALRRRLRDALVDQGALEAWTPTLVSDAEVDLLDAGRPRVRIANPLSAEESVMRTSLLPGLLSAWGRNLERGLGDVALAEIGNVFNHPETGASRATRGGAGGSVELALPREVERAMVVLARPGDDAATAVALAMAIAERLGLERPVVRSREDAPSGWHPTRFAELVDRGSGRSWGRVGEVDPDLAARVAPSAERRVGLLEVDVDAVVDPEAATRVARLAVVPSRFPSALIDLSFAVPAPVNAEDLAQALRGTGDLVEDVALFDVYRGPGLPEGARALAYRIRLSSPDGTLGEADVAAQRDRLIAAGSAAGATLR